MATKKDTLLEEAIADAKQIKDAAVVNARLAILENFGKDLAETVSRKLLAEALEDTDGDGYGAGEGGTSDTKAVTEQNVADSSGIGGGDNKMPSKPSSDSTDIENPGQEIEDFGDGKGPSKPAGATNEGAAGAAIDADGHDKVVDTLKEDGMDGGFDIDTDGSDDDDMLSDDKVIDIEAIIRELEADLRGQVGLNSTPAPADPNPRDTNLELETVKASSEKKDEDEDIDLNELLREVDADKTDDVTAPSNGNDVNKYAKISELQAENAKLKGALKESRDVLRFVKGQLTEANLLNTKLNFMNKVFQHFSLTETQKQHVSEMFGRALTPRDAKLIYATLVESYKSPATKKPAKLTENFSSKIVGSTRPKSSTDIVNSSDEYIRHLQIIAGIIKE